MGGSLGLVISSLAFGSIYFQNPALTSKISCPHLLKHRAPSDTVEGMAASLMHRKSPASGSWRSDLCCTIDEAAIE